MTINTPSDMIETALALRTCPPADKRSGTPWEKHRKTCPVCSDLDQQSWDELAGHLNTCIGREPKRENPRDGELWQIDPDKGRWVKDNYLSPPAVLVARIRGSVADCYPIYPDTDAAGPGDIILDGAAIGFIDIIVETWNGITVKTKDLCVTLGAVSGERLADIRRYADKPDAIPSWALIPLSIQGPDDPRLVFRAIERRMAVCFSMKPLESLFEKSSVFLETMKTFLTETVSDLPGRGVTESVLAFRFPSHMMPAHAQGAHQFIQAEWRTMILREDTLVNYYPSVATLESDETIGGRRTITGQSQVPPGMNIFRLVACLSLSSGMVDADVAEIDEDGFFSVEFDVADGEAVNAGPVFCAIYEKTE